MKIIKKNKFILIPALIIMIVSIVLSIIIDIAALFLSLGILLGVINHFLMVLQNNRFNEIMNSDIEKPTFHSGKFSVIWILLRLVTTGVVTFLSIFLAHKYSSHLLISVVLYVCGYMIVKIIFIASLFLKKEGDNR